MTAAPNTRLDLGFGWLDGGHHEEVKSEPATRRQHDLPVLLFIGQRRSGPSRKMESLIAWVKVSQKTRLQVVEVDADHRTDIVRRFGIRELPSLVLLDRRRVVARHEGRATGDQINELIRPHLA